MVAHLAKAGFFPRLLTTGVHFKRRKDTVYLFLALKRLGVGMIALRLDDERIQQIDHEMVANFVAGACAIGQSPYIRYDLGPRIPEKFYSILKQIEARRFYTQVFFKKAMSFDKVVIGPDDIREISSLFYRLVINESGDLEIWPQNSTAHYAVKMPGRGTFEHRLATVLQAQEWGEWPF